MDKEFIKKGVIQLTQENSHLLISKFASEFGGKAMSIAQVKRLGLILPQTIFMTNTAVKMLFIKNSKNRTKIYQSLVKAYRSIGNGIVVVRSSHISESIQNISSSGRYKTVLGIQGISAILDAINSCVKDMRLKDDRSLKKQSMGIVIQEMIFTDIAGVISTKENILSVKKGIGESLMKGQNSGSELLFDIKKETITGAYSKKYSKYFTRTVWKQLKKVIALVNQLNTVNEQGFDVEFGIKKETVYVFQIRRSNLQSIPNDNLSADSYFDEELQKMHHIVDQLLSKKIIKHPQAVFSSSNLDEILPDPTPMSFAIFKTIFGGNGAIYKGRRILGYSLKPANDLHILFLGRLYFNLELDVDTFNSGFPLDVKAYIKKITDDRNCAIYPEIGLYEQTTNLNEQIKKHGIWNGLWFYVRYKIFLSKLNYHLNSFYTHWNNEEKPRVKRLTIEYQKKSFRKFHTKELLKELENIISYLQNDLCVEYVIGARLGFYSVYRLTKAVRNNFPENTDFIVRSILGKQPTSEYTFFEDSLKQLRSHKVSRSKFINMYGHYALNELELSIPRLKEDSSFIDELVSVDSKKQISVQNENVIEHIPLEKEAIYFRDKANLYLSLRESIKFSFTYFYSLMRDILLDIEYKNGLNKDDIFYLYPKELEMFMVPNTQEKIRRIIQKRRKEFILSQVIKSRYRIPKVLLMSQLDNLRKHIKKVSNQVLKVSTMSGGYCKGKILIIRSANMNNLMKYVGPEHIIVAKSANLGIDPLLRKCAGGVFNLGNILSHGACRARNIGKPAVVLDDATNILEDGQEVYIDANRGQLFILKNSVSSYAE